MMLFAPTAAPVETIQFTVPGDPAGQPRPRAARMGGFIKIYTPDGAKDWKNRIILYARSHAPRTPWTGPVRCSIDFYRERPQRLMTRKYPDAAFWCTVKPDRDNLDKCVLDALTKCGFWIDDNQVVGGEIRKFWVAKDSQPGAEITLELLETTA